MEVRGQQVRDAITNGRATARQTCSLAWQVTFVVAVLLTVGAYGADCREATVLAVRMLHSEGDRSVSPGGTAPLNDTDSYEIMVRLGTDLYTTLYEPKWKWSFKPTDLNVGDEIPVRVDEKNLFIHCGTRKEIKLRVVDRIRAR